MAKLRCTRQRRMVLDAARNRMDHPTADDIYLDVRAQDPHVSKGTVYRNLALLCDSGDLLHIKCFPADRYDLRTDNHYHMHCLECDRVWDAPVEFSPELGEEIERDTGFVVQSKTLLFEGVCKECAEKQCKVEADEAV